MQDDAIRSSDAAPRVLTVSFPEVFLVDSEIAERHVSLHFVVAQIVRVDGRIQLERRNRLGKVLAFQPLRLLYLIQCEPVLRKRFKYPANEALAAVRHEHGNAVRAFQYALLEFRDRVGPERNDPRHHEIQEDPERPHVDKDAVVALVLEEFWSGVGRRATERAQRLVRTAQDAEAEVADLDGARVGKEDILGLQVAMNDVVRMLKVEQ